MAKSNIVKRVVVSWKQFKQQNNLNKTDGNKRGKLNIPKLKEANYVATSNYHNYTLILTEGDSAKALAVTWSCSSIICLKLVVFVPNELFVNWLCNTNSYNILKMFSRFIAFISTCLNVFQNIS